MSATPVTEIPNTWKIRGPIGTRIFFNATRKQAMQEYRGLMQSEMENQIKGV